MADLAITATSVVLISGQTSSLIAGETLVAGDAVYQKPSDSRAWKAQCDGTADEGAFLGIALNGGAAGQPIQLALDGASINIGATTAKTTAYMLSAALGKICPQADLISTNKIVYVGYATDTTGTFVLRRALTGAVV
jgi:hypothetical protein